MKEIVPCSITFTPANLASNLSLYSLSTCAKPVTHSSLAMNGWRSLYLQCLEERISTNLFLSFFLSPLAKLSLGEDFNIIQQCQELTCATYHIQCSLYFCPTPCDLRIYPSELQCSYNPQCNFGTPLLQNPIYQNIAVWWYVLKQSTLMKDNLVEKDTEWSSLPLQKAGAPQSIFHHHSVLCSCQSALTWKRKWA